jgi:hypothetical protein
MPFVAVILWSIILAVMLYPVHVRLMARMGNKWSATLIGLVGHRADPRSHDHARHLDGGLAVGVGHRAAAAHAVDPAAAREAGRPPGRRRTPE